MSVRPLLAVKFGPLIAANLHRRRGPPSPRRHLDEMVVKIDGRRLWLWRAVDDEGDVLDMLVQKRRDAHAAMTLPRKLLSARGSIPRRSRWTTYWD
jgi:transposase-like protein